MGIQIPTRLRWTRHEGRGSLKYNGQGVDFTSQTFDLPGLPAHLSEIDYWPDQGESGRGQLRVSAGQSREMTHAECRNCFMILRQLSSDKILHFVAVLARGALGIKGE